MVEYLGTLTSRQLDLLDNFAASGCIVDMTWQNAMVAELEGTTRLNSDDMRFLRDNIGKCKKPTTSRTGFFINAGGLYASVYLEQNYIGKTDGTIEAPAGLYMLAVKKLGYKTMDVPMEVKQDQVTNVIILLEVDTSTPTGPTGGGVGAIIEWTGNRKFPSPVQLGKENWFGVEFKNVGDATWVGYLGVKLTAADGKFWTYEGDPTKATTVTVGQTKYVYCKVTVPETIGAGNISIAILKYTVKA
jgi:hypothetical protein